MPAIRAAVSRLSPSSAPAMASKCRAARGSFSALANRRSSGGAMSSLIHSAGMGGSLKPCPPMNHSRPRRSKPKSQDFMGLV
jgi:hypothetical protein